MHEVSLVSALVDQIEEVARKESFDHVLEIRLGVGALSGVEPSCLEFCFSEVTRNSVLEGSKLVLESVEIELECKRCRRISRPRDSAALFCVYCESVEVEVKKGREFQILDLIVN